MRRKLLSILASVALIGIVGHFAAKPVLAAVAALVKNIDERGRNPYYQQIACYSATKNTCTSFFPAVPANMRLVVEHINMAVDTPTALSQVNIAGNGGIIETGQLALQGQDAAGNSIYVENQPFLMYYEAGQTPEIVVATQAGPFQFISSSITLTGYLVNLAQ